ncbi:hypothetical protein GCM10010399_08860 [Dactylosporangium fulvum]|uniref:Discoidin domain-containing protein n=1 Tax=Dactylosporangium fulvum TaxID=53359 RepID=A0ABY5W9K8_9ACTN|nr:discoidin domain-containing protein [Dactylosporangium fulvum]UWP86718.1 discoidin domain-containing protein [Dactylosporangium fulvum]
MLKRILTCTVITALVMTGLSVPHPAAAAAPSPAQQWTEVQNLISPIKGVWTTQDYSGAVSDTMPNTALAGNGDIGVTSGGGVGYKTFHLSKGNFWASNSPRFVALGSVSISGVGGSSSGSGNLAIGAAASASSSHSAFPPSRAVNGAWTSGYEGWVSEVGKPQSLVVDLGSPKSFTRYVVRHDSAARPAETANNTKNFTFETSENGTSWTVRDTITNNTAATTDRTITAVTARYIRLNISEPTQGTTSDSINNPRARIGQLEVYGPGGSPPAAGPFREEQNILKGDIDTTMTISGVPVVLKTWTAANDPLVVTSIQSTGTTPVRLKIDTTAGSPRPASGFTNTAGVSGTTTWATRRTPASSAWVSEASMATRVLGASTTVTSSGATASHTVDLPAGATIRIVTAVAGGGTNPTNTVNPALTLSNAQSSSTVDSLYTQHTDWWKSYWLQSYVDLNDDVLEKFYYGHQYLLGSSVRAGKTAPGLYGIWATSDNLRFSGDMHLNYNFQANFYGVYSSNRPELALPYVDAIQNFVPEARRRARQDLSRVKADYVATRFPGGMPSGLLFPVGISPFGSVADDSYHQQVVNSLFAATQYIAYYDYTRDNTFLTNVGYPFLKEVAAFFQNWLEFDAGAQRYNLRAGPHEGTWARNSSSDLGLLRYLLTSLINASSTLNVDAGLRATWQDILNKLAPIPTTVYNGQTVFALGDAGTFSGSDTRPFHPGDNTVNLEFIHPGEVLGINSPAADRQMAINTINAMNSWGQENSFPKVFTQAARVGYPAQALIDQLKNQINQWTVANLRIYDPSHGLEKAGAIEAVNNLLLQSSNGVIRLFPVWPSNKDASFVNLREKNAVVVSSRIQGGRVQYVDFTTHVGGQVRFQNPWPGQSITITRVGGGSVSYSESGGVVTFTGAAGASFTINAP